MLLDNTKNYNLGLLNSYCTYAKVFNFSLLFSMYSYCC